MNDVCTIKDELGVLTDEIKATAARVRDFILAMVESVGLKIVEETGAPLDLGLLIDPFFDRSKSHNLMGFMIRNLTVTGAPEPETIIAAKLKEIGILFDDPIRVTRLHDGATWLWFKIYVDPDFYDKLPALEAS